jgi:hypothetical protein
LGIQADYLNDLTIDDLRKYVEPRVPVIVSVQPDGWDGDHWTIVKGFDDQQGSVYLTNHYNMTIAEFMAEWSLMDTRGQGINGEGFVCRRCPG